jgi:hypothetical protein
MIELQQLTSVPIGADAALRALTLKAIYTAVVSGLATSASISGTGPSAEEKNQMFKDLQQAGLTVTNSGSTFTVGWGSK